MKHKKRMILVLLAIVLGTGLLGIWKWEFLRRVAHRSPFERITILEDHRWRWGSGAPTLLLAGKFDSDQYPDVLVVAEPVIKDRKVESHFFIIKGSKKTPTEVVGVEAILAPGVALDSNMISSAAIGDLNNDGQNDVVVGYGHGSPGEIGIWISSQNGRSLRLDKILKSPRSRGGPIVRLGDVTGDGKLDIVSMSKSISIGPVELWRQEGNTFANSIIALRCDRFSPQGEGICLSKEWQGGQGIEIGDLDGDKDLDIVMMGRGFEHTVVWLLQNVGNGAFRDGGPRFMVGNIPHETAIRGPKLILTPVLDDTLDALGVTHLWSDMEGVAFLGLFLNMENVFRKNKKEPSWESTFPKYPYDRPTYQVWKEKGIEYGITAGKLGSGNPSDILVYGENAFFVYSPKQFRHNYKNEHDLDFRGSFLAGVACDLDGDGIDEPVFLVCGRLPGQEEIGVYLYIYDKPIFPKKPTDTSASR